MAARRVADYHRSASSASKASDWSGLPEVPTGEELRRTQEPSTPSNVVSEPWQDRGAYLAGQYAFCREEVTYALRDLLAVIQKMPNADEKALRMDVPGACVYEKARVVGFTLSPGQGVATKLSFSTIRSAASINWDHTKRLVEGTLVAVSPVTDHFTRIVMTGLVAASPASLGMSRNPRPEVQLFLPHDFIFDVDEEYLIVETTSTYFESLRHTMTALQRMNTEPFPLDEHVINGEAANNLPAYVQNNPNYNVGKLIGTQQPHILKVGSTWSANVPSNACPTLDHSQMDALEHMLGNELAIVQGPPGTGKTHVSVMALRMILSKHEAGDPPIIITCQTNHALDQLLAHVATFESNFIRLGSRSQSELIKKRTLFEVRCEPEFKQIGSGSASARRALAQTEAEIRDCLEPLGFDNGPFNEQVLHKYSLITKDQLDSLVKENATWIDASLGVTDATEVPAIVNWVGPDCITPAKPLHADHSEIAGLPEPELEDEELDETLAENAEKGNQYGLKGTFLNTANNFMVTNAPCSLDDERLFRKLSRRPNLMDIKTKQRPIMYAMLVRKLKAALARNLQALVNRYNQQAREVYIAGQQRDVRVLETAKVVGMTTTGFAKFRPLVHGVKARVVLIEEAGESLEPTITPVFVPSIEQVILVGDHQQLRARCQKQEHQEQKWHISMFERLIMNGSEYRMLNTQRRMTPEISRLLHFIYEGKIKNHESTRDPEVHPDVPGMGGHNSGFIHLPTDEYPENRDSLQSAYNDNEAELIAGFAQYLIENGTEPEKITILTFYNGQRRLLISKLRKLGITPALHRVCTVDSYQGEENEVILLSLVRNNRAGALGFTTDINRVCVAVSRARNALYIFGNAAMLAQQEDQTGHRAWADILAIMQNQVPAAGLVTAAPGEGSRENRIGPGIALKCREHGVPVATVIGPEGWESCPRGCARVCGFVFPACGHVCQEVCHRSPHGSEVCQACEGQQA